MLCDVSTTNQSFGELPVDEEFVREFTVSCFSPPYDGINADSTGIIIFWPGVMASIGGVVVNCGELPDGAVTMVGTTIVVSGEWGSV